MDEALQTLRSLTLYIINEAVSSSQLGTGNLEYKFSCAGINLVLVRVFASLLGQHEPVAVRERTGLKCVYVNILDFLYLVIR